MRLVEFGSTPVALDIYPEGYEGPSWETSPFRHRTGWLMVSEAWFPMPFITWRQVLVACVTDQGEEFPPSIASRLFRMPTSLPRPADHDPPEELEEITERLYEDFLHRTNHDNLLYLEEAADRAEGKLQRFEMRSRGLQNKIDAAVRRLRVERRRSADSGQRDDIDVKLHRLSAMTDQLAESFRRRAAEIRAETDDVASAVLAVQGRRGRLEHLYTVSWRTRSSRTRPGLKLPLFQEEPWSVEAWRDRIVNGPSVGWGIQKFTSL